MAFSLVEIVLAVLAIVAIVRIAQRAAGFAALLVVAVLIVVWVGAARHQSTRNEQRLYQSAMSEQEKAMSAMARQQAVMIQQVADQSARYVEQVTAPNPPPIKIPAPPTFKITMPTTSGWVTPPAAPSVTAPQMIAGDLTVKSWIKITPILLMPLFALAAFAAVRRGRGGQGGSGIGWVLVGVALFLVLGFYFWGTARRTSVSYDGETTAMRQIGVNDARRPAENAWQATEGANSRESIDAIWNRLNATQIKLDGEPTASTPKRPAKGSTKDSTSELQPNRVTTAQAKLNEAAKVLESAAEGMTDSSSQGWLVVMAEALLKATAKNAPTKDPTAAATPPAVETAKLPQAPIQPTVADKPREAVSPPTPDWVTHPPGIVGNVRKFVVHAGPYKTLEECHRELEVQMRNVVESHATELARTAEGEPAVYPNLFQLGIGTDYILRELCTEEFVETSDFDIGEMKTAHALMEFTAAQDAVLLDRWTAFARRAGITRTAAGSVLVVGCLALGFGLLKVDTWTRGYYTKRLFLGVPAAIILVVMWISQFA